MKTLNVNLPQGGYPIHIGADILDNRLPPLVQAAATDLILVVTNTTVDDLYPQRVARALAGLPYQVESCVLPDGEQFKTLATLNLIYDRLMELGGSRKTLVVAFGGGVIGDMAGFAAATFMRGVPFIQVPTTLLSQVDSSVGGKTGVNHPLGKNCIGAFNQPEGVVIELEFLASLPRRELRSGLFELIKHGLIRDLELLEFLENNRDRLEGNDWEFWGEAVYRSCRVKARVVEADETEQGLRAVLNFGHSLGHLIETHTGYGTTLHGEAVGVGMVFAGFFSHRLGLLDRDSLNRMIALLGPLITPVELPPLDEAGFRDLLLHDKKTTGQSLGFVLLKGLGDVVIRKITPAEVWPVFLDFLEEYPQFCRFNQK